MTQTYIREEILKLVGETAGTGVLLSWQAIGLGGLK